MDRTIVHLEPICPQKKEKKEYEWEFFPKRDVAHLFYDGAWDKHGGDDQADVDDGEGVRAETLLLEYAIYRKAFTVTNGRKNFPKYGKIPGTHSDFDIVPAAASPRDDAPPRYSHMNKPCNARVVSSAALADFLLPLGTKSHIFPPLLLLGRPLFSPMCTVPNEEKTWV